MQKRLLASVLPVTVLLIVPLSIDHRWSIASSTVALLGIPLVIAGLTMLFATASLFSSAGEGTLAPWSPTQKLVITGPYAHSRNPMISGVLAALLGESLLFESTAIFLWFLLFFLINNAYFSLSEEPGLVRRFGEDYKRYRNEVPRWIPRMKPWIPNARPEPGTEKE